MLDSLPPSVFVARLDLAFQTRDELFYLMEYCPGGSLKYQLGRVFSW